MAKSSATTSETISIDSSGNAVALELNGRDTVTLHISEDAAATYQVDGRKVGGTWRENLASEYTGGGPHSDTFDFAAEEMRVRCSSGTAGSGDEATITVMAGGG